MPRVRFEPTIPVFERTEAFHALDREAIVTGRYIRSLSTFRGTYCLHFQGRRLSQGATMYNGTDWRTCQLNS
jgi:hypothetical protein